MRERIQKRIAELLWHVVIYLLWSLPVVLIFVGVVWLLNVFDVWMYVPFVLAVMYLTGRVTRYIWETRKA